MNKRDKMIKSYLRFERLFIQQLGRRLKVGRAVGFKRDRHINFNETYAHIMKYGYDQEQRFKCPS